MIRDAIRRAYAIGLMERDIEEMKKKADLDGHANALATLLRVDFDLRELIHEVAEIGGLSSLRQALTMQADKIDAVARWMNGEK